MPIFQRNLSIHLTCDLLVEGDIRKWLKATDPSVEHDNVRKGRQEGTGEWFLNSEDFKSWNAGENGVYWIHGNRALSTHSLCSSLMYLSSWHWEKCALVCTSHANAPIANLRSQLGYH
jgi:hypothetical protein